MRAMSFVRDPRARPGGPCAGNTRRITGRRAARRAAGSPGPSGRDFRDRAARRAHAVWCALAPGGPKGGGRPAPGVARVPGDAGGLCSPADGCRVATSGGRAAREAVAGCGRSPVPCDPAKSRDRMVLGTPGMCADL